MVWGVLLQGKAFKNARMRESGLNPCFLDVLRHRDPRMRDRLLDFRVPVPWDT